MDYNKCKKKPLVEQYKKSVYLLIDESKNKYIQYVFGDGDLYYKNKYFYNKFKQSPKILFYDDINFILVTSFQKNNKIIDFKLLGKFYKDISNNYSTSYYSTLDSDGNYCIGMHQNIILSRFLYIVGVLKNNGVLAIHTYKNYLRYISYINVKQILSFFPCFCPRDISIDNIFYYNKKYYLFDFDDFEFGSIYLSIGDLFDNFSISNKNKENFLKGFGSYSQGELDFFILYIRLENQYKIYKKTKNRNKIIN